MSNIKNNRKRYAYSKLSGQCSTTSPKVKEEFCGGGSNGGGFSIMAAVRNTGFNHCHKNPDCITNSCGQRVLQGT